VTTTQVEAKGTDMSKVGFWTNHILVLQQVCNLKSKYSIKIFQDLKIIYGINVEKELINLMVLELQFKINHEIVNFVNNTLIIINDATISDYADRWKIKKYYLLAIKLGHESAEISYFTRKNDDNTIFCTLKIVLKAIDSFKLADTASLVKPNISGINSIQICTFDKKYNVIIDNFNRFIFEYVTVMYKDISRFLQCYCLLCSLC